MKENMTDKQMEVILNLVADKLQKYGRGCQGRAGSQKKKKKRKA